MMKEEHRAEAIKRLRADYEATLLRAGEKGGEDGALFVAREATYSQIRALEKVQSRMAWLKEGECSAWHCLALVIHDYWSDLELELRVQELQVDREAYARAFIGGAVEAWLDIAGDVLGTRPKPMHGMPEPLDEEARARRARRQ